MCWVSNDNFTIIFGVIPFVGATMIMFYCNNIILYRLLSLYKTSSNNYNNNNISDNNEMIRESFIAPQTIRAVKIFYNIFRRLTKRARLTLYRIMILPLLYLIVIAIISVYALFFSHNVLFGVVAVCASVSSGIINFIVWILLDQDVLLGIYIYLYIFLVLFIYLCILIIF